MTTYATPNNANVPTGVASFEYIISSATVTNSSQPQIKFQIKKDGSLVTFELYSAATNSTTLSTGFSGGPCFDLASSQTQDGIAKPADFNNSITGTSPANVSLLKIWNGTSGTLSGPDGSGTYTAIITASSGSFPVGSTMHRCHGWVVHSGKPCRNT